VEDAPDGVVVEFQERDAPSVCLATITLDAAKCLPDAGWTGESIVRLKARAGADEATLQIRVLWNRPQDISDADAKTVRIQPD
jgi:hypothetical protein